MFRTQARRRFPESFKREAVDQVLGYAPRCRIAKTQGIAEGLLGEWRLQSEQQGDDSFADNGNPQGERAEFCRFGLSRAARTLPQVDS
ncbi:transposase [Metapseudomonas furukawaii]